MVENTRMKELQNLMKHHNKELQRLISLIELQDQAQQDHNINH